MTRAVYLAECFECEWKDPDAKSTDSARQHANRTGHTAACAVERDYIYRGRASADSSNGDDRG